MTRRPTLLWAAIAGSGVIGLAMVIGIVALAVGRNRSSEDETPASVPTVSTAPSSPTPPAQQPAATSPGNAPATATSGPVVAAGGAYECLANSATEQKASPAETPVMCGTAIEFANTPAEAAALAKQKARLQFILHVSGNFEDPQFT